jgi:hypothetical protein
MNDHPARVHALCKQMSALKEEKAPAPVRQFDLRAPPGGFE